MPGPAITIFFFSLSYVTFPTPLYLSLHKTTLLIPQSVRRALERKNLSELQEIKDLVERLISERQIPPEEEDLPSDREVLKTHTFGSITYRLEKVSCGKNCKGCPHGPYWYGYWREGGKTRSKYIGKNFDAQKVKRV